MAGRFKIKKTALIPFAMLVFGYALVTGGFKYESIKSKKDLAQLFEAKIRIKTLGGFHKEGTRKL